MINMAIQPNNTIYINNLNEKVKKDGMLCAYVNHFSLVPF